jgi:hypothetical protein
VDFEVQRCTRHCAATGRELAPGETYYSVLTPAGASVERQDFSAEAWTGPPEGALGWWKSQIPAAEAKKIHFTPNEVLLDLFEQLDGQTDRADLRYVLALLLIRRRVLRLEDTEQDAADGEQLVVSCPRRSTEYKIRVTSPDGARAHEIQEMLAQMLVRDAA